MKDIKIKKIIRTNRRTISLHIDDDTNLIVRAPEFASQHDIYSVVQRHSIWVERTREKVNKRRIERKEEDKNKKGKILYLGEYYPLILKNDLKTDDSVFVFNSSDIIKNYKNMDIPPDYPLQFKDAQFYLDESYINRKAEILTNWYKSMAFFVINERVKICSIEYGISFAKIRITGAKTRWGSCFKRDLNFTYRLVMAPIFIIDYVVTHELIHILFKNHSKCYWEKVVEVMPDYKERRRWLKENGYKLEV